MIFLVLGILVIYVSTLAENIWFKIFVLLDGIILLGYAVHFFSENVSYAIEKKKRQKEEAVKQQEEKEKKQAEAKAIREGTWEVDPAPFCRFCFENKIEALDNEYSIAKARTFIVTMFKEKGYSEEDCKAYLDSGRMKAIIEAGTEAYKKEEKERLWELKKSRRASASEDEKRSITRAESLANLWGEKKRIRMLENQCEDCKKAIEALENLQRATMNVGEAFLAQQRKESSWGTAGGIASGIAGPGAGVTAALNTMAHNAQIQEHNQEMVSGYMAAQQYSNEIWRKKEEFKEKLKTSEKELNMARTKVAFRQPSAQEIWANMSVYSSTVEKNAKSNVIKVSLNICLREKALADVPDGVETVVDGVLNGTVLCDDVVVGTVYLPLPVHGIPNREASQTVAIQAYYDYYVNYEGKYRIKFYENQNLWIMEA